MVSITIPIVYDNNVVRDQKVWRVVHCTSEHEILMDRDVNAAVNILSLLRSGLDLGLRMITVWLVFREAVEQNE